MGQQSGSSGVEIAGGGPASGEGGFGASGGGGGLMGILGSLLKDPQVMKEISGLGSKFASFHDASNKLSPGTRNMISQAIQQAHQQERPQQQWNPYLGDMSSI